MVSSFDVWLAIIVGSMPPVFCTLAFVCLICFFAYGLPFFDRKKMGDGKIEELYEEKISEIEKVLRRIAIGFVVFCVLALITPDKKEIAAIYLIPKIANNEVTQKLPSYVEPFLRKMLDMEDPKTGK